MLCCRRETEMTEVSHRFIETNGIRMHIAEQGSGPLVLLCHGFPKSWYSWRHQIGALADAGFHVVAPDMRGYGQTEAPEAIDQYTLLHLVGDMVGVLDALGAETAVIARSRLGRTGRLARRAAATGPVSCRDRAQRAIPAARQSKADDGNAPNQRRDVLSVIFPAARRGGGRPRGGCPSLGPRNFAAGRG